MTEWWTIQQVAEHLGLKVPGARGQLSRMGIRGEVHYPADAVRQAHAARKGRGNRTPRRSSSPPQGTHHPSANPEEGIMSSPNAILTIAEVFRAEHRTRIVAAVAATGHRAEVRGAEVGIDLHARQALAALPEGADGRLADGHVHVGTLRYQVAVPVRYVGPGNRWEFDGPGGTWTVAREDRVWKVVKPDVGLLLKYAVGAYEGPIDAEWCALAACQLITPVMRRRQMTLSERIDTDVHGDS